MKINEVEALVGVTKKNIRFYEEQGLLSPRRNSENGYRDYGSEEVDTLRRIKLMRKLGVPIGDIRQMQSGSLTVADGMRRHLVTLEREEQNIKQAVRLCSVLTEQEIRLDTLDAEAVLTEMEEIERSGTVFQDKQRQDIRVRYIAPIISCMFMIVLMLAMMFLFGWSVATDPQNAPPVPFLIIVMGVPSMVIIGVLLALGQRIREIGKGEIDDARKY